eukprot:scaffold3606_cov93-Skeletonema_marinoi.AAC.1
MEAVLSKPLSPICDDGCFDFVYVGGSVQWKKCHEGIVSIHTRSNESLHPEELLRLTAMEAVLSKPLSPFCDDGCFDFVYVGGGVQ